MTARLQITVRDMLHSPAVEAAIRRKLARLERVVSRITAIYFTLEAPHHHHRKGNYFRVKVDVRVPDAAIVVSRVHDADIYAALNEACQAAREQLTELANRRRDAERMRPVASRGAAGSAGNE